MLNTQMEVLDGALESLKQGERVTLVSVARTWGTSPRPVGALLAVASNGHFYGSVSGGCVEDDLIGRLVSNPPVSPQLVKYGETAEERNRFGLPCGGTLELILEPLTEVADVQNLINVIERREVLIRKTNISTGETTVSSASYTDKPELTEDIWCNLFGPTWRMLIIGAGQTSHYLAEMAQALGYSVSVSDPRPDYQQGWHLDSAPILPGYPDDVVEAFNPDQRTAVVALTHDPRLDDAALLIALKSKAFYVGALGSMLNNENRRNRLREHFDFTEDEVSRLHGPVGLPIGSKSPPEIALAILAELTSLRNGIDFASQLK